MSQKADLIRALRATASLLRTEYPDGYSLAEIIEQWGLGEPYANPRITREDLEAVRRVEHLTEVADAAAGKDGKR